MKKMRTLPAIHVRFINAGQISNLALALSLKSESLKFSSPFGAGNTFSMGSMAIILPKLSMSPNSRVSLVIQLIESSKTRTSVQSTAAITSRFFFLIGHAPSVEDMSVSASDAEFVHKTAVCPDSRGGGARSPLVFMTGTSLLVLCVLVNTPHAHTCHAYTLSWIQVRVKASKSRTQGM
jgi:hypothetical protein